MLQAWLDPGIHWSTIFWALAPSLLCSQLLIIEPHSSLTGEAGDLISSPSRTLLAAPAGEGTWPTLLFLPHPQPLKPSSQHLLGPPESVQPPGTKDLVAHLSFHPLVELVWGCMSLLSVQWPSAGW